MPERPCPVVTAQAPAQGLEGQPQLAFRGAIAQPVRRRQQHHFRLSHHIGWQHMSEGVRLELAKHHISTGNGRCVGDTTRISHHTRRACEVRTEGMHRPPDQVQLPTVAAMRKHQNAGRLDDNGAGWLCGSSIIGSQLPDRRVRCGPAQAKGLHAHGMQSARACYIGFGHRHALDLIHLAEARHAVRGDAASR
jgi:hypothetical protein